MQITMNWNAFVIRPSCFFFKYPFRICFCCPGQMFADTDNESGRSRSQSGSVASSSDQSVDDGPAALLIGLGYKGTTGRLIVEVIQGSNFNSLTLNRAPGGYSHFIILSRFYINQRVVYCWINRLIQTVDQKVATIFVVYSIFLYLCIIIRTPASCWNADK